MHLSHTKNKFDSFWFNLLLSFEITLLSQRHGISTDTLPGWRIYQFLMPNMDRAGKAIKGKNSGPFSFQDSFLFVCFELLHEQGKQHPECLARNRNVSQNFRSKGVVAQCEQFLLTGLLANDNNTGHQQTGFAKSKFCI